MTLIEGHQIESNFGLLLSSLNEAKLDLLTSSTYLSLSLTLFLRDSIYANKITISPICSLILLLSED